MAVENFTTWTESDADSVLTVTSSQITATGINGAFSTQDTVYKDFGASYWSGNFTFRYGPLQLSSPSSSNSRLTLLALANLLPDSTNVTADSLVVRWENTTTNPTLYLCYFAAANTTGTADSQDSYTGAVLTAGTSFYIEFARSGSTVTCKLYSDAYTTLVATLTITPATTRSYQYAIAATKFQTGTGATVNATLQNLDLAAGVVITYDPITACFPIGYYE